ncbi:MAG: hypothetical protein JNJ73_10730 [Hyphomonadaceae bacterium]|nr:hypothetical protein [Hyphomonadaceae bacterium]
MSPDANATLRKRLYTHQEIKHITGLGDTKLFELYKNKKLERTKIGAATRITAESLERWLASLPRGEAA